MPLALLGAYYTRYHPKFDKGLLPYPQLVPPNRRDQNGMSTVDRKLFTISSQFLRLRDHLH